MTPSAPCTEGSQSHGHTALRDVRKTCRATTERAHTTMELDEWQIRAIHISPLHYCSESSLSLDEKEGRPGARSSATPPPETQGRRLETTTTQLSALAWAVARSTVLCCQSTLLLNVRSLVNSEQTMANANADADEPPSISIEASAR